MYFTISFLYTPQYSHLSEVPHGIMCLELMAGVEPATSSLPRMRSTTELHQQHELQFATTRKYERINKNRAENGAQTRDPQLGRLVLYRLSYFRELTTTSATVSFVGADGFEPPKVKTSRFTVCPIWPLWNTPYFYFKVQLFLSLLSDSTNDPEITNHVLWPTELKRRGFVTFYHDLYHVGGKAVQRYYIFLN